MGKGCWLAFDFSVYCVIWRLYRHVMDTCTIFHGMDVGV
jgi:hypothetical protein